MDAQAIITLIGGILTILAVITGSLLWYVRIVVRDEVRKATQPIQPGYRNGGQSLADVAFMVKRIAEKIGLDDD